MGNKKENNENLTAHQHIILGSYIYIGAYQIFIFIIKI